MRLISPIRPIGPIPCLLLLAAAVLGGCGSESVTCPRVVYLDGAGWYAGSGGVRDGLREANYPGPVERFNWTIIPGALPDHLLAGPEHPATELLVRRITALRRANPDGHLVLMGLSSGCSVIVYALENLTPDVKVDEVVFLSPSTAAGTDLREALLHVTGHLYVTTNPGDPMLAVGISSGPESGRPAGLAGFTSPPDLKTDAEGQQLYRRIEYIRWKKEYSGLGWQGGHVGSASREFIRVVIAPKIMPR